jgi:hypothetical protein
MKRNSDGHILILHYKYGLYLSARAGENEREDEGISCKEYWFFFFFFGATALGEPWPPLQPVSTAKEYWLNKW